MSDKRKVAVDEVMDDIVSLTNQIAGLQMLLDSRKQLMAKYFEKSGNTSISSDECTVYVAERTKIDYDIEAILHTLPKSKTDLFISRTYTVKDWDRFVDLCKRYGIPASIIKPYISVEKQIEQDKLKQLYEKGIITIGNLKGCYNATVSRSINLRMKNVQREIPLKEKKDADKG